MALVSKAAVNRGGQVLGWTFVVIFSWVYTPRDRIAGPHGSSVFV